MTKVYIALQDNDVSHYLVEAIEADNPDVTVQYMPAMIRLENEHQLIVKRATVEEKLGRDWDVQELSLSLITIGGNVEEDEDAFTLTWNQ